jgi:hypothetical protein
MTCCTHNTQTIKIMVNDCLAASFLAESLPPIRECGGLGGGDGERHRPR